MQPNAEQDDGNIQAAAEEINTNTTETNLSIKKKVAASFYELFTDQIKKNIYNLKFLLHHYNGFKSQACIRFDRVWIESSPSSSYSQLSSIRMKSLIPRFSRNTPEEAVVLNRKEMSALSSPWKVGKWRYDVSLSKNAAFQKFSGKHDGEKQKHGEDLYMEIAPETNEPRWN